MTNSELPVDVGPRRTPAWDGTGPYVSADGTVRVSGTRSDVAARGWREVLHCAVGRHVPVLVGWVGFSSVAHCSCGTVRFEGHWERRRVLCGRRTILTA